MSTMMAKVKVSRHRVEAIKLLMPVLLAFLLLPLAGCVPINTTYFEAVDLPWSVPRGEETVAKCPATDYGERTLSNERVWVVPQYQKERSKIRINVHVGSGLQSSFQSLTVKLTSLDDVGLTTVLRPRFYSQCLNADIDSCPRVATELVHGGQYIGVVDIPAQFEKGFVLELREPDGQHTFDWSPQKFALRSKVIARGTFGCR